MLNLPSSFTLSPHSGWLTDSWRDSVSCWKWGQMQDMGMAMGETSERLESCLKFKHFLPTSTTDRVLLWSKRGGGGWGGTPGRRKTDCLLTWVDRIRLERGISVYGCQSNTCFPLIPQKNFTWLLAIAHEELAVISTNMSQTLFVWNRKPLWLLWIYGGHSYYLLYFNKFPLAREEQPTSFMLCWVLMVPTAADSASAN